MPPLLHGLFAHGFSSKDFFVLFKLFASENWRQMKLITKQVKSFVFFLNIIFGYLTNNRFVPTFRLLFRFNFMPILYVRIIFKLSLIFYIIIFERFNLFSKLFCILVLFFVPIYFFKPYCYIILSIVFVTQHENLILFYFFLFISIK